jgi:hypothetical protein
MNEKNINMTANCQIIYDKFCRDQQKAICALLGKHYSMRPDSIQNNWFGGFKIIPEGKLLDTYKILISYEINQNVYHEK